MAESSDASAVSERKITPFESAPLDILLSVIDFLQLPDAACMALGSRTLLAKLGDRYFNKIRCGSGDKEQRALFLQTLSRQFPNKYFCAGCSTLHSMDPVKSLSLYADVWPEVVRCDSSYNHTLGFTELSRYTSTYQLSYMHIQLVMEQHRCGPEHGIGIDKLSHLEVRISQESWKAPRRLSLTSVDHVIRADQLHMRRQYCLLLTSEERECLEKVQNNVEYVEPCRHESESHGAFRRELSFLIDTHFQRKQEGGSVQPCLFEFHCVLCGVEGQTELFDGPRDSFIMVITVWLNLGYGQTIDDPKWRAIEDHSFARQTPNTVRPGDARSLFETSLPQPVPRSKEPLLATVFPLDALTRRNLWLLDNEHFMGELQCMDDEWRFRVSWHSSLGGIRSTWVLSNEGSSPTPSETTRIAFLHASAPNEGRVDMAALFAEKFGGTSRRFPWETRQLNAP